MKMNTHEMKCIFDRNKRKKKKKYCKKISNVVIMLEKNSNVSHSKAT